MREPDTDTGGTAVPPTVLVAEMGDGALLRAANGGVSEEPLEVTYITW